MISKMGTVGDNYTIGRLNRIYPFEIVCFKQGQLRWSDSGQLLIWETVDSQMWIEDVQKWILEGGV